MGPKESSTLNRQYKLITYRGKILTYQIKINKNFPNKGVFFTLNRYYKKNNFPTKINLPNR